MCLLGVRSVQNFSTSPTPKRHRSGRPLATSHTDGCFIVNAVPAEPDDECRSAGNRLHQRGLPARRPARVPDRTTRHRRHRLKCLPPMMLEMSKRALHIGHWCHQRNLWWWWCYMRAGVPGQICPTLNCTVTSPYYLNNTMTESHSDCIPTTACWFVSGNHYFNITEAL